MSKSKKKPSAPELGIRSLTTKWSPGIRACSAEEYNRFTNQLSRELQATYPPEHIAVIAAQHMIYADELRCLLEENTPQPEKVFEMVHEISNQVSLATIKAWRTHLSDKRAQAVRSLKSDVKALAIQIANDKWQEDTLQKIKIGKMAESVFDDLKKTEHCKLVSSSGAVRRWIHPVAPDYAKKTGSQRNAKPTFVTND